MSARRLRVILARNARVELSDILLYSGKQWGRQQRRAYKTLIRNSLSTLSQSPNIGRSRDELSVGLRSHPVGNHVLYYWITDTSLIVSHILHNRRDPDREDWSRGANE